jgi:hypothetical protein
LSKLVGGSWYQPPRKPAQSHHDGFRGPKLFRLRRTASGPRPTPDVRGLFVFTSDIMAVEGDRQCWTKPTTLPVMTRKTY